MRRNQKLFGNDPLAHTGNSEEAGIEGNCYPLSRATFDHEEKTNADP